MVERSETGPGKPYWRMPDGETGETVAGVRAVPRTGEGGEVLVGFAGIAVVIEAFACCFGFVEEEKIAAVTAEPAKADAAAMRASVVLDMVDGVSGNGIKNCKDSS